MKKTFKRIVALVLILWMSFQIMLPVSAEENTINIYSAEDLIELSDNCSFDTWSQGKTIVLQSDISMKDVEFKAIATFGGTFDGNGHTISDLEMTDAMSPAGFFRVLQSAGIVKNLNIIATVCPDGDALTVGGIVGENNGTIMNCSFIGNVTGTQNTGGVAGINSGAGKILDCKISGVITGEKNTGGAVGYNLGIISSCQNEAYVNTESVDTALDLKDVGLNFTRDLANLETQNVSNTPTDTGGIAGYSTGTLENCTNSGTVGHQHVGYNVGGIVGRNNGYITGCTNKAEIYGRKEVGGISGQMEPYIVMRMTEDTLSKLKSQTEALNSQINQVLNDVNSSVGTVTNRLNNIANYLDCVAFAASNIKTTGTVSSYVSGSGSVIKEGNATVTAPEIEGSLESEDGVEGSLSVSSGVEAESTTQTEGSVSANTQIEINTSFEQLAAAVNGMSGQMRQLNNEIAGSSGVMTSDLQSISNQVDSIFDTIYNAANSTDRDLVTDTSEHEIDAVKQGKAISCTNNGSVYGDLNVGGIAGSMSIEYELDPEDDVTSDISGTDRKRYELKAILQNCTNKGTIASKKNYAGSICGKMTLGLITGCEGFGDVTSETGDYVGGIAGFTGGSIRKSFAKCILSGKDYVGGIIGCGVTEDLSGSGSSVSECYSFVQISDYEQYAGAISGGNAGAFSKNYFIEEGIAGINHTSYAGKAEKITYEALLKVDNLPKEFQKLSLEFVVDDQVIETVSFHYGESFDESTFPQIPEKEGYYGVWDTNNLTNLQADTVVTAVYKEQEAVLASEQTRKDGRSVFFVEGQFAEYDVAKVLVSDTDYMEKRTWIDKLKGRQLEEAWLVEIPDDGLDEHNIRYLPLNNNKMRKYDLFINNGNGWEKVEGEMNGSYLTFTASGNKIELADVSIYTIWWGWFIVLLLLISLGSAAVLFIRKNKLTVFSKKAVNLIGCFVVIILIIIAIFVNYFKKGVDIYLLIQDYVKQSEISMELEVQANMGSQYLETNVQIDQIEIEDKKVVCIEQIGIPLYFYDDDVFLENGKAYKISELTPEYTELLNNLIRLYQNLEITTKSDGDTKTHSISVKENDAKEIVEVLLPSAGVEISDTQTLNVDLIEQKGVLKKICFQSKGSLNDLAKTTIEISAQLTVTEPGAESQEVPEAVQTAIKSGEYKVAGELNTDLFRLLFAWMNFEKEESVNMEWEISADCGPASVNQNGSMETAKKEETEIPKKLLEIVYQICLNGNYSCSANNDTYIYTLNLDEEGMKSLAYTIVEEAAELQPVFESGSIQLTVKKENLSELKINFTGNVKVLEIEVPVAFTAEITF